MSSQDDSGQSRSGAHSPSLAHSNLVPSPTSGGSRLASPPSGQGGSSLGSKRTQSPHGSFRNTSASSLEGVARPTGTDKLSVQAASLVTASRRGSTRAAYASCWKKWARWCGEQQVDLLHPSLTSFVEFLTHLHNLGLAYRTICSHRSAISQSLPPLSGVPLGEHLLVSRVMRGIFNTNPPRPRYSSTWSVGTVTSYLKSLGAQ